MSNSRLDQILEEVMGYNVRRQLDVVVPDFFDEGYVVMQMQPKPESEQPFGYPHIVAMNPFVVASNHSSYKEGIVLNQDKFIPDLKGMLRDGYNVTVSPDKIRERIIPSREILESEPCDGLVIAELDVKGDCFGDYNKIIYAHDANIGGGRTLYTLNECTCGEAMRYGNVHFAFLPQEPEVRRKSCYIDRGWVLNF